MTGDYTENAGGKEFVAEAREGFWWAPSRQSKISGIRYRYHTMARGCVTHGRWRNRTRDFYDDNDSIIASKQDAFGEFLVGTTPPTGVMEVLNVGNVTANYSGNTLFNDDTVNFTFNFADGTGRGRFGNAFTTTGNIVGPDFISNPNGFTNATGKVTGSFFGSDAQVFGGLADVMLINEDTPYVEVFVTETQAQP